MISTLSSSEIVQYLESLFGTQGAVITSQKSFENETEYSFLVQFHKKMAVSWDDFANKLSAYYNNKVAELSATINERHKILDLWKKEKPIGFVLISEDINSRQFLMTIRFIDKTEVVL